MIIQPTISQIVILCVLALIGWAFIGLVHLPWNPKYDPKGDDPYRHCPKEEE